MLLTVVTACSPAVDAADAPRATDVDVVEASDLEAGDGREVDVAGRPQDEVLATYGDGAPATETSGGGDVDVVRARPVVVGPVAGSTDDVCRPVSIAHEGLVTSMSPVLDGRISEPCFSQPSGSAGDAADRSAKLDSAWSTLSSIAPPDALERIDLFVGYERCDGCDALAFVQVVDRAADVVALAVDVSGRAPDPVRFRVTVVHELAHVLAQRPGTQLNPFTGPSRCHTYHDGTGCVSGDSYVWAWIREFWSPEMLAAVPAAGSEPVRSAAIARCSGGAAFTGVYAASRPEEDFAETFAAYVLDAQVDPALSPKLAFFDRHPEFVKIRAEARAAGLSVSDAHFDTCATPD